MACSSLSSPDNKQLIDAIQSKKFRSVRRLLKEGCNPDSCLPEPLQTPLLIYAIKNSSTDCAKELVKYGANVNVLGDNGMTPCLFAASVGDLNMLKFLADAKGDFTACNENGITGLMFAAQGDQIGHLDCLQCLINLHCKIDRTDNRDRTALIHAVLNGNNQCVRRLVDAGANLNKVDSEGYSALMHAFQKMHYSCARILLDNKNINVNISTVKNETAISIVLQQCLGEEALREVEALLRKGADMTRLSHVHTSLHEMIARNKTNIVRFMVINGCLPVLRKCNQPCFKFKFSQTEISPIAVALLSGLPEIAMYFIVNNYVISYDWNNLWQQSEKSELLDEIKRSAGEKIQNVLPKVLALSPAIFEQYKYKEYMRRLCVSQWHYLCQYQGEEFMRDTDFSSCDCPDCKDDQGKGGVKIRTISIKVENQESLQSMETGPQHL